MNWTTPTLTDITKEYMEWFAKLPRLNFVSAGAKRKEKKETERSE